MARRLLPLLTSRYSFGLFIYVGVAVASALTEWGTFFVALQPLGPVAAAILAFFTATMVNWLLSRSLAFRPKRGLGVEFLLVIAISALAFGSNFAAFLVLFRLFGVDVLVAKVAGTFFGFAFNYLARQFFIFSSTPLHALDRFAFLRRRRPIAPSADETDPEALRNSP